MTSVTIEQCIKKLPRCSLDETQERIQHRKPFNANHSFFGFLLSDVTGDIDREVYVVVAKYIRTAYSEPEYRPLLIDTQRMQLAPGTTHSVLRARNQQIGWALNSRGTHHCVYVPREDMAVYLRDILTNPLMPMLRELMRNRGFAEDTTQHEEAIA